MDASFIKPQRCSTVFGQKQRAVKVCKGHTMRKDGRGGHGKGGAYHAADHNSIAFLGGCVFEQERLSQPARLVEFNVYHIVFAFEFRQRGAVMAGLVGANGQGPSYFRQHVVGTSGKRLLNHLHAEADQMRGEVGVDFGGPAFIGINNDTRFRCTTADGL